MYFQPASMTDQRSHAEGQFIPFFGVPNTPVGQAAGTHVSSVTPFMGPYSASSSNSVSAAASLLANTYPAPTYDASCARGYQDNQNNRMFHNMPSKFTVPSAPIARNDQSMFLSVPTYTYGNGASHAPMDTPQTGHVASVYSMLLVPHSQYMPPDPMSCMQIGLSPQYSRMPVGGNHSSRFTAPMLKNDISPLGDAPYMTGPAQQRKCPTMPMMGSSLSSGDGPTGLPSSSWMTQENPWHDALQQDINQSTLKMTHVLVCFRRLYGVFYIPRKIRGTIQVGELSLCETGYGESIGRVVCDLTAHIEKLVEKGSCTFPFTNTSRLYPEPDTVNIARLYPERVGGGLPVDYMMSRLPCVLRRGVNRHKKKVYFCRRRDVEALQMAQTVLMERNVQPPLVVVEAEYQVDFRCITLHLKGRREECPWSAEDFKLASTILRGSLRCDVVLLRFSVDHPELLNLTRGVVGDSLDVYCASQVQHWRNDTGSHTRINRKQRLSYSDQMPAEDPPLGSKEREDVDDVGGTLSPPGSHLNHSNATPTHFMKMQENDLFLTSRSFHSQLSVHPSALHMHGQGRQSPDRQPRQPKADAQEGDTVPVSECAAGDFPLSMLSYISGESSPAPDGLATCDLQMEMFKDAQEESPFEGMTMSMPTGVSQATSNMGLTQVSESHHQNPNSISLSTLMNWNGMLLTVPEGEQ